MERILDRSRFLSEADELHLLGRTEALAERGKINGFQEIGLSLGVIAVEQVHSVGKGDRRQRDIPEILYINSIANRTDHLLSCGNSEDSLL